MALVTSDELAKDVASAEALLDRHQVRIALLDWRPLSYCITCNIQVHSFTYCLDVRCMEK